MGMACVVLSRELSREDAAYICRNSPIKIEVFAHGALCMCYSGQCAMSALIGERSGNRGTCAQPCRLPYRVDGGRPGHPLSLKDACLAAHLGELRDMGVSILKLEGRMKRPEYVAVGDVHLRRPPAGGAAAHGGGAAPPGGGLLPPGLHPGLLAGPSRPRYVRHPGGRRPRSPRISSGRPGPSMSGRPPGRCRSLSPPPSAPGRPPPSRRRTPRAGASPPSGPGPRGRPDPPPHGGGPDGAAGQGPGAPCLRRKKSPSPWRRASPLPASAVNGLRREALEGLAALRSAPPDRRETPTPPLPERGSVPAEPLLSLSLFRGEQLTEALMDLAPALIYLPAERIGEFTIAPYLGRGTEFAVALPRICADHQREGPDGPAQKGPGDGVRLRRGGQYRPGGYGPGAGPRPPGGLRPEPLQQPLPGGAGGAGLCQRLSEL